MRRWQFDVLFVVMVLGDIFLLIAKGIGVAIDPSAFIGFGTLTTYVLTQRNTWTTKPEDSTKPPRDDT